MFFINNKAAANGIVGFAQDQHLARKGEQEHAVLMQREVLAAKHHATFARKIDFMRAVRQQQPFTLLYVLNKSRNAVDIDRCRGSTRQTHNNGDVGMVAFTRKRKRAVYIHSDARHLLKFSCSTSRSKNSLPAFIGPTVWELDGPMPTLNMSKTLITGDTPHK